MGRLKKEVQKVVEAVEEVVETAEAVEAPPVSNEKTILVGHREIKGVVVNGVLVADDGCSYGYSPEIEVQK